MSPTSIPSVLEPGATFSIEPGIYVRANLFEEIVHDTERNRRMIAEAEDGLGDRRWDRIERHREVH